MRVFGLLSDGLSGGTQSPVVEIICGVFGMASGQAELDTEVARTCAMGLLMRATIAAI